MNRPNFKEEIAKDMAEGGFNVHDHLKDKTVPELREICDQERNPFAVCAISVTGDMNISSIIRTASLHGAECVKVVGRRKFDRRGLVGSNNYIDIEFFGDVDKNLTIDEQYFINAMNGYTPIFIEQGGVDIGKFNWPSFLAIKEGTDIVGFRKPCLIVGNENRGIPQNILDTQKHFEGSFTVSVPQRGVIRSHNVSVAAGIVMSNLCLGMHWL